jgi:molecular chaperone Hsp33
MKEQDCLRRFIFEEIGIRGEWVRLHDSWKDTKKNQQLDSVVQEVLGQALAAVVLLSVTIKYEGSMVLQVQGNGALKAVVAHSTHDRKIRGLARSDAKVAKGNLTELMGEGRLVITLEPKVGEPYQGIVPLLGNN